MAEEQLSIPWLGCLPSLSLAALTLNCKHYLIYSKAEATFGVSSIQSSRILWLYLCLPELPDPRQVMPASE